jgi:hypothetical protein
MTHLSSMRTVLPVAAAYALAVIAPDIDVSAVRLIKAGPGAAVVRADLGPLGTIQVGDRIGRTRALVKEITKGRVVLEEQFVDANGAPNVAQIIIKDGEKGGTRYVRRSEEKRPTVVRPTAVDGAK